MTVGTGIGAGIVIGGRPLHGLIHPEFGHIRIPRDLNLDPFPGSCPSHGDCLEGLASGRAIRDRWQTPPRDLPDDHIAWWLTSEYIALGLTNLIFTISPQRVIIGGGIAERLPIGRLQKRVAQLIGGYLRAATFDEDLDRFLVRPGLGDQAGILGAVALALGDEAQTERPVAPVCPVSR